MSYIIFTAPRTGSTEFIERLALATNKQPHSSNLIEFFNPPCVGAFGDLIHLYYNPKLFGTQTDVLVLKENIKLPNIKCSHLIEDSSIYMNKVKIQFDNVQQLEAFLLDEAQRRIEFITNLNHTYFVKQFIGLFSLTDISNQLLNIKNARKIFYYRKDSINTIFSGLIKAYYFDRPNSEKKINIDAHNWDGKLEPVEPNNIVLEEHKIKKEIEPYINLLKFFKNNRDKFDVICSYEDVFVDGTEINFDNGVKLTLKDLNNNHDGEHPMPYLADKTEYFTNSNFVIQLLNERIKECKLEDVIKELGITGPW